jgi:hypothetical protein
VTDQVADRLCFDGRFFVTNRSKATPIVFTCAGVLLLLFYRNDALFIRPEFWAEDIDVYFTQNRLLGAEALLLPHNGFVQFICRIFAWVAGLADPIYAPRLYASFFVASIFATAAIVYTSPIFSGWSKPLATLTLLAAPVNSEVFYGMCYTQWVMGPLVALALCETPKTRSRATLLASAFVLIGVSSPFVLVATPFVAWKAISERSRYPYALCVLTVVSSAFHIEYIAARFTGGAAHGSKFIKIDALASVLYRWITGAAGPGTAGLVIISILSIAFVGCYLWDNRRVASRPIIYFFFYGAVLLTVCCASIDWPDRMHQFGPGARYFYIPAVVFLWAAISIEQKLDRNAWTLPMAAGFISLLFFAHTDRAGQQFKDTHWPATVGCLAVEKECVAEVNPSFLGRRVIPTDYQVRTLAHDSRRAFQIIP